MRYCLGAIVIFIACIWVGCGGKAPRPENELNLPQAKTDEESFPLPSWFLNLPQDSLYQYERGEAIEQTRSIAERIARQNATAALARWLNVEVNEVFGQSAAKYGESGETHFSWDGVIEEATSEALKGVEPSPGHMDTRIMKDGQYHVYMLMRMPREQIDTGVKKILSRDEELYEILLRDGLVKKFEKRIRAFRMQNNKIK